MPAFEISIDDQLIATVNTVGLLVFAVHLSGNLSDDELVSLHVRAMRDLPDGDPQAHCIFVSDTALQANQTLAIAMTATGVTNPQGKTIHELYPDDTESVDENFDFKMTESQYLEARARPTYRSSLSFRYDATTGEMQEQTTPAGQDTFGFSVLWDWTRPESARVSIHSSSLENIRDRSVGVDYVRDKLEIGQRAAITMLPSHGHA